MRNRKDSSDAEPSPPNSPSYFEEDHVSSITVSEKLKIMLESSCFCNSLHYNNFCIRISPTCFLDYFQRRSLRERKKKTYKDDFDYNLSDEEGEKDTVEGGVQATYPGDGAGQVHLPVGPEVEETTTVEKILAMRTKQARYL